ncbi:hypothetical protein [uncultured Kushneria sp.]|uniref:hypothetical protein n=1 Tax=uncultured Kushneria sp. TaxID=905033 RepID=UPI00261030B5|nr:hypothetical protein [uncultured Kushneria sp.]
MDLLAERAALQQTIEALLTDTDRQHRLVLLDHTVYRVTAERITDPQELEQAVQEHLKEVSQRLK